MKLALNGQAVLEMFDIVDAGTDHGRQQSMGGYTMGICSPGEPKAQVN